MSGAQVLLVDDDADIRRALGEILEDQGYSVTAAANGQEALDVLQRGSRPAVILLDLMMPVMDGYQFLAHHTADPRFAAIPVVVITAGATVAENIAAQRVMHKPLRVDKLMTVLGDLAPA